MKIIVLGLPRNVAEEELTEIFAIHGKVSSATIVMDEARKMSKGFGFVEMDDEAEANAAIAALHGNRIGNQKIRVKAAQSDDQKT